MTAWLEMRQLRIGLAVVLAMSLRVASAATPPKEYRISGVVVSSRDGSPVPYCRLVAYLVTSNQATSQPGQAPQVQFGRQNGGRVGGPPNGPRQGGAPNTPPEVTADASGKFSLDLPRAGAWRLSGTARGFRSQNYDQHESFYSDVVLTEAAPSFNLTFRLVPDSVLTGLVFDEAGEPVAQAQVIAELIPPPVPGVSIAASRPRPVGFGQTDDRGRYELGGLAPGQYHLRVQAQPWYAAGARGIVQLRPNPATQSNSAPPPDPSLDFIYPVTWFPGTDDESTAEPIVLGAGEERQADFHLSAMPSIHLMIPRNDPPPQPVQADQRVRQVPQRPAMVTRIGGDGGMGMQQIGPGGMSPNEWDFGGLSPGTYEVRIPSADGRSFDVRQIEVRSGSQTVITMEGAKPLVRVALKLDGVPDSDGAMVEFLDTETGARVNSTPANHGRPGGIQMFDQPDDQAEEETQSTSRTVMLAPHQYELNVSGGNGVYLTGISAEGAKASGRTVMIGGAATVTLHLANKHASLEGVAHIDGGPSAGAMVLLVPTTLGQPGDLTAIQRDETNTDGSFSMSGVTPGRYILVAIDHGWSVDWRNPATLGQYLLHGTPVDLRTVAKAHGELQAVAAN